MECVAIHTSKIYYFSNSNAKPKGWWFFRPPPKLKIYVFLYILFPRSPACFKRYIFGSSVQGNLSHAWTCLCQLRMSFIYWHWSDLFLFFSYKAYDCIVYLWNKFMDLHLSSGTFPHSYVLYLFIGGQDLIHLFKMHINGFYFMFSERSECSFAAVHSFAGASIGFIQVLLEEEMFG